MSNYFLKKNSAVMYNVHNMVENKIMGRVFNGNSCIGNLEFLNVGYIKCIFKEVEFKNIRFSNVVFEDCTFEHCNFNNCSINYESFLAIFGGDLKRCFFEECNLEGIFIKRCKISGVSFENTNMGKCNLIGNSYNSVRFIDDCNLRDCIIKDTSCSMNIIFINENSYTKLSYGSCIGPFNYKDNYYCLRNNSKHSCAKKDINICSSYMAFGNQYLKNDIQDKYGECFYESKKAKHRTLKGKKKIISFLSNIICGYGERPYRSFGVSLVIVLICAIIYLFTGIETKRGVIKYNPLSMTCGITAFLIDFLHCIHFSLVTFSTVGYGDLIPYGIVSMVVSNVEIILGVIMVAIWTSTLVRKMTR